MKVFKFGGASVKDAESVRNVAKVLKNQGYEQCIIVVSAMGKTTNALEKVVQLYFEQKAHSQALSLVRDQHFYLLNELFPEKNELFAHREVLFPHIEMIFAEMDQFLLKNKSPNYNFVYDQIISCGEIISSKILSEYLNAVQIKNEWLDARELIKTDNSYREGIVDWDKTEQLITAIPQRGCYVTQGFIGSDENSFTVTLGREGSDYSAGIFSYCIDAKEMTIWKDVPGVMTGDPRKFKNTKLLSFLSYEEAIEMAYYGASVIHPKTLQPLQRKHIPFFVKSFLEPHKKGTQISDSKKQQHEECWILKENQKFINISTKDFSFITEEHVSLIFNLLSQLKIKVSLIQNSAISLNLCIEDKFHKTKELTKILEENFHTQVKENVSLLTIRNYNPSHLDKLCENKTILLKQISNNIAQIITL